jgi:tRNA nucleotidyltransferase (CCA-adding enzyme)
MMTCLNMMKTFLVGGAVRDKLLGYPSSEKDWVVVGATPKIMEAQGFVPVGKDFPVFLHPQTREEYALARTERKTGHGYAGFTFYCAEDITLEDDLRRRDLTINAIAEDAQGNIIDPYNGRRDLEQKILRHVSPAFAEDPVRILRIARFAARYHHLGFRIAEETLALMRSMVVSGEADHLVAERVWKETQRALGETSADVFIRVLRDCGALARILPELDRLFEMPVQDAHQPAADLGSLALLSLQQASQLSPDPLVRFATLLHALNDGLPTNPENNTSAIHALCERIAAPKEYRELAVLVAEFHVHCHCAQTLEPERVLTLLLRTDAFRRPQRFENFLLCCEAIARSRDRALAHYLPADFLRAALQACLAIDLKAIAAQGLTGKAFGDELDQQRLTHIQQLRTMGTH